LNSEKVVPGLNVVNLALEGGVLPTDGWQLIASAPSVATRASRIAIVDNPFLARYRTIGLWSIFLMALNFSA
jgi:hypothetical protein